MRTLLLGLPLAACDGKNDSLCSTDPVDGVTATVNGDPWSASGPTWDGSGGVVHLLNSDQGAGWFSVVAQLTVDGLTLGEALDASEFPIEVTLKTGDEGGFAIWYTSDGDTYSTTQGGEGTLYLSALDGDQLTGCMSFTAGPGGADVVFEDGRFTAGPQ